MSKRKSESPPSQTPRAAIYVRVSTEEQATEGVSLDAQVQQGTAYAQLHRLDLAHVLEDAGISAGKPLADRPRGAELLRLIQCGEVQHVIALKLDRLFRDAVDCLQVVRDWDHRGVAMHLIDLGGQSVNTASATGRFMLTVIAGAAEMERNLIRERTKAALQYKRQRGDWLGGLPLGFTQQGPGAPLCPDPVELNAVRLILRRRRAGDSFRAIAARLERDGHHTKRGGRWAAKTVRQVWARRGMYSEKSH